MNGNNFFSWISSLLAPGGGDDDGPPGSEGGPFGDPWGHGAHAGSLFPWQRGGAGAEDGGGEDGGGFEQGERLWDRLSVRSPLDAFAGFMPDCTPLAPSGRILQPHHLS